MKNLKLKAMLLGLAGASIMTNAFAAGTNIVPANTTVPILNASNGTIVVMGETSDRESFIKNGDENKLTITKFVGNTKDSTDKVIFYDGTIKIPNLAEVLNGSLLNNKDVKIQNDAVMLVKKAKLEITGKEIFDLEKNSINDKVAQYLDIASGYLTLTEDTQKSTAVQYGKILKSTGSDTQVVIMGKLKDEHNKNIDSMDVKDAVALAKDNAYTLSATVKVQGKNVNKVVFTKDKGDEVTVADNTIFIPKQIMGKNLIFDKSIKNVEFGDTSVKYGEKALAYRDLFRTVDNLHYGDTTILGNKEQGGDVISGGEDLTISLVGDGIVNEDNLPTFYDDDMVGAHIIITQGPTNNINAKLNIVNGGVHVKYATANFNKPVNINNPFETRPEDDTAVYGRAGRLFFNDEVNINAGRIVTSSSDSVFKKDVIVKAPRKTDYPHFDFTENSNLVFFGGSTKLDKDLRLAPGLLLVTSNKFQANKVFLESKGAEAEFWGGTVNINDLSLFNGSQVRVTPEIKYDEETHNEISRDRTKFTAKNVSLRVKDTALKFEDSIVNIQDLDMKDGATLSAENSQVSIKGIFMDDRFHSQNDYDKYFADLGDNAVQDYPDYKNPADPGAIEFKNSDVEVSNMNIEGMNTVTFDNEKNDKVYTVDMLNVARGGEVLLNGGTLKVTKALTNSYVADKHLVENPPKPGETYDPVGELILNKGTLDAENLRQLVTGELVNYNDVKAFGIKKEDFDAYKKAINKDKPFIILDENGVIKTKTSQIFAKGASAKEVDSGDVTNKSVFYVAGTLEFNDPKYTNEYLQAARKSLAKEPASTKVETIKSKTVIKMTGEEVKPTGEVVTETPLDTAVDNSNGTVTVENNKPVVLPEDKKDATKIVVGETADDKAIKVDGNLQAPTIDASKVTGLKEVEVNSGKTLTIGGMGKELITGLKDTKDMTYTVTGEQSTLKIGAIDKPVEDTTIGNLEVKDKAILEVNKTNLDVQGTFATNNGATIQIANSGSLSLANNKEEAPKVNISGDTTIMVGDKDTHGRLMLKGVALNGARVLIDPNWDSPYYSEVNLQDLANNTLDGKLTVGKNSVLNVDPTQEDIDLTTTHEDANEAVLGVYTPTIVDPDKGSILVDPTLIGTEGENSILAANLPPNTVAMADNTVFYTKASTILDAADKNMGVLNAKTILLPAVSEEDDNYAAQAYISGSLADYAKLGNALNNNQKLYLVKAETPMDNGFKEVGFDDVADLINLKGQLAADKQGVELVYDNDKNKSVFNKVKDAFPGEKILLANNIDAALAGLVKDAQDPAKDLTKNPALNFLSDAIINTDRENVLNSMANMADLGGVTKESFNNLNKFNDTVENFSSERNLWATYTHSNNNSDVDLTGNKASYSAKSNGLVLGGSLAQNDKQNWGMAVFYNKGKVTANSGLQTKNDVRSYGIGFYDTNKLAKGELVSQFAVSRNNNDLEQLGTKAKANTSNYSLAVKYQQPMAKANGTVTPYIGLRFAHLGGANFTNSLGFKYNVAASNVVSMPFGVKYAGQVVKGNTTIAPFAELGYTPVLSGKNHKVTVGLNATDSFTNTVLDNTWHAKIGANITKGNNTFGLSYARVQGHQTKDNQFMATAEFKF